MRKFQFLTIFFLLISFSGMAQKMVLVFHETQGFKHQSIPDGVKAIQELGTENGFNVLASDDSTIFLSDLVFDLVIFLNTTGDVLNDTEEKAFQKYIENGGNYFGIHAAADTEYDWPFYHDLVGAYFESHPKIQEAHLRVLDSEKPSTTFLPEKWTRTDEWYNYKDIKENLNVLVELDESSYEGGKNGEHHPTAWYQETGHGGIAIYTGGGHTSESYKEPLFRKHIQENILWALNSR